MSYRNPLDQQLRRAFNMVKDLAIDVTLTKKTATGFNFGTGSVTATDDGTIITKAVVTKTVKKDNVTSKTLMLKTSAVGNIGEYSEIIIEGDSYVFGKPSDDSGYILLITVFKEG